MPAIASDNVRVFRSAPVGEPATWLAVLRHYLTFVACANLLWEIGHLPLYTKWQGGAWGEIAFAVAHCTGGDILIAATTLLAALLVLGHAHWPSERYWAVAAFALVLGLGYTAFSEWLNAIVRQSWTYSELMPTLPPIGIGVSPLAQWVIIPLAGFWLARPPRANRGACKSPRCCND